MDDTTPRYSLVAGEGDGAMLGLAAGDTAGGAWELGYSAHTEQATVVAYHLIERQDIDEAVLVESMRELDGADGETPVYRAETPHFRVWLDGAAAGHAQPSAEPSLDAGPRSVPIGVVNRRDPEKLGDQAIRLGTLFHTDALTVLGGGVVAAAAAASCFGQSGRDLIAGITETAGGMAAKLTDEKRVASTESLDGALAELADLAGDVGVLDGAEALEIATGGDEARPWDLLKAGILLAAPVPERDHLPVEQAARVGGSALGAIVGAIVGARVGIKAWPWPFANDTWFAEIGRRLARGPAEIRDLPIPYAVEHHLMSGERPGFH